MEQLVMLLVFALAAALCVQVFVLSDQTSRQNEARDQAVVVAQNAAELLKDTGGDYASAARILGGTGDHQGLQVTYTEDWTPGEGPYLLAATPQESTVPGLGLAEVAVWSGEDQLFALTVAWQTDVPAAEEEVAQP
jgi:type II secretory pathway pseudopilin PulG